MGPFLEGKQGIISINVCDAHILHLNSQCKVTCVRYTDETIYIHFSFLSLVI